ncbi:MAG: UDP-N-acetylglucosamine 4,6-dehydratase [Flavobacteriales bacterium]|nr:UDP-N-acetylglucosamine 4,6-dehydratase [Flavobacteriales bacterium]|tara:strand:+ start:26 stop:1216 length:1191 start_codon:yes stop_codon:yes gene_type:complete
MLQYLDLIDRKEKLFEADIQGNRVALSNKVRESRFLVLGGAGTIGQAVVKEIFKRKPKKLHVVDLSENNLVELVRDIRSSFGYIDGEFRTYVLDIGSLEYDAFIKQDGQYDYVLNLSALKHVRSEKDPFTLMRMIEVNILNTIKTIDQSIEAGVKKYFCVSTDKAANPVNMMGGSKLIMEMFLMKKSSQIKISTARFANVAFSDGSLLFGFEQRIKKSQPLAAPSDIKRYFVIPEESGELCLMSCMFGENRDVYFPKLDKNLHLITFAEIGKRFLKAQGYESHLCNTEDEARDNFKDIIALGKWPCLFSPSNTTGEKGYEEFFTAEEKLDFEKHESIGIVKNDPLYEDEKLIYFLSQLDKMRKLKSWNKEDLVKLFHHMIPNFGHQEVYKNLDSKM